MAAVEEVLTNVALGVIDHRHVIVIKNLCASVSQGTVVNWVEVVTDEDVAGDVCHYHQPVTSVALTVLSTDHDIQENMDEIQKKSTSKPLGGKVVEVFPIGESRGLLVLGNQGHSEDSLTLYFESWKSGGQEDCVQSCISHPALEMVVAVFFPSSLPTAVKNILQKGLESPHILNAKSLTIVPYYPVFHDDIIAHLGQADGPRKGRPSEYDSIGPGLSPSSTPTIQQPDTTNTSTSDREGSSPSTSSREGSSPKFSLADDDGGYAVINDVDVTDYNTVADNNSTSADRNMSGQVSQFKGHGEDCASEIKKTKSGNLCLLFDGPGNSGIVKAKQDVAISSGYEHVPGPGSKFGKVEADHFVQRSNDLSQDDKDQSSTVPTMRRNVASKELELSATTKTIPLAKHKVILLRISGFGRGVENCQIDFDSEISKVKISGTTPTVKCVLAEMFKKLEKIQHHYHQLSVEQATLLEHKMSTADFTKRLLKDDKIYAYATCSAKNKSIQAYAFQRDHAKRAVEKFLLLLQEAEISYAECHFKYLASPGWQTCVEKWEGQRTVKVKVVKPEKMIKVTSVSSAGDIVQDIKQELEKFTDVTGKPITVDGGKGKLVQYCLQQEVTRIDNNVRQDGGHLAHGPKGRAYVFNVQGSETVVQTTERQLHTIIRNIWEGPVDLRRAATKTQGRPPRDEEVSVMIEGISSRKGKDFLKRFSKDNSCVVLFTPKAANSGVSGHRDAIRAELPITMRPSTPRSQTTPNLALVAPIPRYGENSSRGRKRSEITRPRLEHQQMSAEFPRHAHRKSGESSGRTLGDSSRRSDVFTGRRTKSVTVKDCTITAKKGSITEQHASVLVNVVEKARSLTESVISKRFCEVGGAELEQNFRNVDTGSNVVLCPSSGGLMCDMVCHMVLPKWKSGNESAVKREVQSTIDEVFTSIHSWSATSIVFPSVGTGKLLGYPSAYIVPCLVSASISACRRGTSLKNITFSIYNNDELEVFIEHLEKEEYDLILSPLMAQPQAPLKPMRSLSYTKDTAGMPEISVGPPPAVGTMTLYSTSKEKGEAIRQVLSGELRTNFLAKEEIPLPAGDIKERKIQQLCSGKPVWMTIKPEKRRIRLFGEKGAVDVVSKEVLKLLLENRPDGNSRKYSAPKHKRGSKEYWLSLAADPPAPYYWKHFQSGFSLLDEIRTFFKATPRTEIHQVHGTTFHAIKNLVEKTFDGQLVGKGKDATGLSHRKLEVQQVERIENFALYKAYSDKRLHFFQNMGHGSISCQALGHSGNSKGPIRTAQNIDKYLLSDMYCEINEHYFFHGTQDQRIKVISENGLDPRFSANGMFGSGIYGAESSTKADQYADDGPQRQTIGRKMLLIRLLLGEMFVTNKPQNFQLPPCKNCREEKCMRHKYHFDSVVGDGQWLHREFVVYDKAQCYPEYIITYNRR